MKKIFSFILISFFIVFSCYSQGEDINTKKIKKYSKSIYKQQQKLFENQIAETQEIIDQIDSTTNLFEYRSYKKILQKLNSQLESTKKNGSKYYFNNNNTTNEQKLIGEWHLEYYEDNVDRNEQQMVDLEIAVADLKENFKIIIYPDLTFQRYGFTETAEEGDWRLSEDGQTLFLKNNEIEDEINIEGFTETKITFIIVDDYYETTTKLTLKKQ